MAAGGNKARHRESHTGAIVRMDAWRVLGNLMVESVERNHPNPNEKRERRTKLLPTPRPRGNVKQRWPTLPLSGSAVQALLSRSGAGWPQLVVCWEAVT